MPANLGPQLAAFLPEIFLALWGIAMLLLDIYMPRERKTFMGYVAIAGLLLAIIPIYAISDGKAQFIFSGEYVVDSFGIFFRYFAVIATAIVALISMDFMKGNSNEGEFYTLLVFVGLGVAMMGASADLIMIFLTIEFVSILSFILTGYLVRDLRSGEASLKYLLFGSVSAAMMLFGMSLIYGITGELELARIAKVIGQGNDYSIWMALALVLGGVGFKVAMVPFHLWSPDAYEGAPTPITAFLSVAPKAAGLAVLLRLMTAAFPTEDTTWVLLLAVIATATMTLGNLVAIQQKNLKRLLAYSSIAHAGYFLIGIVAFDSEWGKAGLAIYLLAYLFTNLGAFAIVIVTAQRLGTESIESYNGLAQRAPWMSAAMVVFLFSLAGIPPLGGFVGKLLIFAAAIQRELVWLALVAVVNTVISLYYYVGIIKRMYLMDPTDKEPVKSTATLTTAIAIAIVGTVAMGVYPQPFLDMGKAASELLLK